MSSRLHSKYHRHNHHTRPANDPRYPDSSHDPIASHESPFLGDFVMSGTLSAMPLQPDGLAIRADGIISTQLLQTDDISIVGNLRTTFNSSQPVTANGEFLILKINGTNRAIRLWDGPAIQSFVPAP